MNVRLTCFATVCFCISCINAAPLRADDGDGKLVNWLAEQARPIDYEDLSVYRSIYYLLAMGESCHKLMQQDLAKEFLDRAIKISETNDRKYHSSLVTHAIAVGQIELAEKLAEAAGSRKDRLLDRVDVAKYAKSGDKTVIKNYPRDEMDLFNALDLTDAMIQRGDYKAVEEFVTDIKIAKENDPRTVGGIAYEKIALKLRDQGDLERAKDYIDKAVTHAGHLFYTGYGLKVTQKSIHGTLKVGLDRFAQRGVAHRGHMGRELVQGLVRELHRSNHIPEAKRVAHMLEKNEDVQACLGAIAKSQAKTGDIRGAYDTIDELEDPQARNLARLGVAIALWQSGKVGVARKHANSVYAATLQKPDKEFHEQNQRLVGLYAMLRSEAQLKSLITRTKDPVERSQRILAALRALTEPPAKENADGAKTD